MSPLGTIPVIGDPGVCGRVVVAVVAELHSGTCPAL